MGLLCCLEDLMEMLDLTTCLLTLTVAFVVWYFYSNQVRPANCPPWPSRPLPVVGHLFSVFQRDAHEKWRKELGDIYSLKFGSALCVFLNNIEDIREAFVKHGDDFSDREVSCFDRALREQGLGIIQASGEPWKESRTVAVTILRSLGMGKNVLADKIQEEVDIFLKFLADLGSEPTDIRSTVSKSVSNVTCAILLGERFDYDDPTFTNIMDMVNYNAATFGNPRVGLPTMWPWLIHIPGDFFLVKKITSNMRDIRKLFIQHYKAKRGEEALEDESRVDNFVAAYMREQKRREAKGDHTYLSDANLERTLDDLFFAGAETTGTTINWAIGHIGQNPEVLEKIHAELDREVGRNRSPTMQDKVRLPYLNAFISETQRYSNIVPMGVAHKVARDTQFRDYVIPAGSMVFLNLSTLFFDKKVWGDDADKFRPERFLDDAGNVKNFDELIPFSIGRRACAGEALAKMSLFLYLANMFQRFTIINPDPSREIEKRIGLTATPGPFKVRLVPRN